MDERAGEAAGTARRRAAAGSALALWVLGLEGWFHGPLLRDHLGPLSALLILLAAAVAAVVAVALRSPRNFSPGFVAAVAGACLLATLVRLPALAAPGSLISSDSAVAGIIAQEVRAGQLPPPIYAPGFPYEGTLKAQLTALLGRLLPGAGTPFLYALCSHAFYLLWTAAVMVLARDVAGMRGALGAGLFMAVPPRFLVAFSLNNVGQYPEVNALGTLGLALLVSRGTLLLPCFLVGLAVWQQLLGVYFVIVALVAVALTPALRQAKSVAGGVAGFVAGSYPVWAWNATHGWATLDILRRGSKQPADRLAGLPERLGQTVAVSFPKMFGLTDAGLPSAAAVAAGLALPLLVLMMVWARRREAREGRGRRAAFLVGLLFVVVVGVFSISKFSFRGLRRPRYLIPVYTSTAVALGWGLDAVARRSRAAAAAFALAVVGLDLAGLVPWLKGRAPLQAAGEEVLSTAQQLGIRTGYSGFWIGPRLSFLSEGRLVLSGELGPDVSGVHPPHAERVRADGPDAFVLDQPGLATELERRLDSLHVGYQRTDVAGYILLHHFSRRVALEDVAGYDAEAPAAPQRGNELPDDTNG
ncbi:MAG: hypothetical protein DMF80_07005 [Acidobacteria bacterium]|nr:MAG: hypothetical protein DMF80_07005 [Acidobacteriota bacterium]